jgi:hypothetical protein
MGDGKTTESELNSNKHSLNLLRSYPVHHIWLPINQINAVLNKEQIFEKNQSTVTAQTFSYDGPWVCCLGKEINCCSVDHCWLGTEWWATMNCVWLVKAVLSKYFKLGTLVCVCHYSPEDTNCTAIFEGTVSIIYRNLKRIIRTVLRKQPFCVFVPISSAPISYSSGTVMDKILNAEYK